MQTTTAHGFRAVVAVAFVVAVLGGIWRGAAACGGYAWHDHVMFAALAASGLTLILFASNNAPDFRQRALLAAAVVGTFFAVRALASPFYPTLPGFGDYVRQVGLALSTGSC